jgi:hypothetical protein
MQTKKIRTTIIVVLAFEAFLLLCCIAVAQSDKVNGVINGRSGATMTVQTQNSGNVMVVLTPATQVEEPEGVFRKKTKSKFRHNNRKFGNNSSSSRHSGRRVPSTRPQSQQTKRRLQQQLRRRTSASASSLTTISWGRRQSYSATTKLHLTSSISRNYCNWSSRPRASLPT